MTGVALLLSLIGVLLAASAGSAQTLFRSESVVVYDSTGKTVGALSRVGFRELTFRTGAGRTLIVSVTPSFFVGSAELLLFPQAGCMGQPFLLRASSGQWVSSYVGGPRQTAYVQAGAFSRRTMRSYRGAIGGCINSVWTADFAPADLAGIDFADYFTPPYSVRATPGDPVPTAAVAEPLETTDRFVVIDAVGKKVGGTLHEGFAAANVALVTDSGLTLLLAVFDSHITTGEGAYFASTDCTGPAFIDRPLDELVPATTLVGPRWAVHQQSGEFASRRMASVDWGDGQCMVLRERFTIGVNKPFAPTAPLGIELADYFTPPFTVRAGRGTRPLPRP